jgi:Conjugal transfer protein TraD
MAERKADTRAKIMLGGLVVKAGLAEEDSAVILGILVEAAEALAGSDGELARRRFRRAGDQAFSEGKAAVPGA